MRCLVDMNNVQRGIATCVVRDSRYPKETFGRPSKLDIASSLVQASPPVAFALWTYLYYCRKKRSTSKYWIIKPFN